jgi:hypothetical protein
MDENEQKSELELMLNLTKEFQGETDRAAAVLSAAYLDHLLGELIAASMAVEHGYRSEVWGTRHKLRQGVPKHANSALLAHLEAKSPTVLNDTR